MSAPPKYTLPALPWAQDALVPYTSANTISFHYGKHHQGYVNKLNELVAATNVANLNLEQLILEAHKGTMTGIYNNASQTWNHTFFWNSIKPSGGGKPDEKTELGQKIVQDFGSYEKFAEGFKAAAVGQFGSGWAWLALDSKTKKLKVLGTANADSPLIHHDVPILTCDVWEHAYYLDYQNKRPDWVTTFVDHLVNWEFANNNFKAAH